MIKRKERRKEPRRGIRTNRSVTSLNVVNGSVTSLNVANRSVTSLNVDKQVSDVT